MGRAVEVLQRLGASELVVRLVATPGSHPRIFSYGSPYGVRRDRVRHRALVDTRRPVQLSRSVLVVRITKRARRRSTSVVRWSNREVARPKPAHGVGPR
jgi:hypothetical protein